MIYARRRPARKHQLPILGSFLHDIVNAPVKEVVNEKVKYTYPAVNVKEYENHFLLQLAVPGFTKKEISINVDEDKLIISSEKEGANDVKFTLREFNYGSFTRKFTLPENIDVENIEASFKNGILTLTIPKMEEVKPREINIK